MKKKYKIVILRSKHTRSLLSYNILLFVLRAEKKRNNIPHGFSQKSLSMTLKYILNGTQL